MIRTREEACNLGGEDCGGTSRRSAGGFCGGCLAARGMIRFRLPGTRTWVVIRFRASAQLPRLSTSEPGTRYFRRRRPRLSFAFAASPPRTPGAEFAACREPLGPIATHCRLFGLFVGPVPASPQDTSSQRSVFLSARCWLGASVRR